jgi:hypothetical protein
VAYDGPLPGRPVVDSVQSMPTPLLETHAGVCAGSHEYDTTCRRCWLLADGGKCSAVTRAGRIANLIGTAAKFPYAQAPLAPGRRRRHVAWSFSRPNQQDLAGGVVDDETGFLAEASRTQVGLIPVSGHDE